MNKAALLIGVSEYNSESGLKPLPSAAEDVQAMQRILLQSSEFTAENISVLTNPQKHDLEEAIYQLFTDRQKEDLLLFYFSGHGIKDETGKLYFSLPTTRKNQNGSLIKHTAIPATVLHESMNDSRSTCQVLVLDCCFSGAFAKGLTVKDDGNIDIRAQLGGKGRAIFTSSNSIEYSFHQDNFKLSVYTHFFVEGLETGAADLDSDGLISANEMHTYVSGKVKQAAPKMTPQFFPGEQGHKIYLAHSPKNDPQLEYRKAVEQKVNQGSFQVEQNRFSISARQSLNLLIYQLKVPRDISEKIESEVLQPIQEYHHKMYEYEQTVRATLEDEGYPFSETTRVSLSDYQTLLGLRNEDVKEIESNILKRHDDISLEHDLDYKQLRDLLEAKKWQEADEKTYRLIVKAADREKQGYLDFDDIENFPCAKLRIINELWVQFSNGCFGFSIQKQIWEQCGNKLKDDKDWGECYDSLDKFGEAVGWGERRSWFSTQEEDLKLIPEIALRSSLGHMPVSTLYLIYPLYRDEADQVYYFLNYFFSRVETCEL